jgi:hypothetical protein
MMDAMSPVQLRMDRGAGCTRPMAIRPPSIRWIKRVGRIVHVGGGTNSHNTTGNGRRHINRIALDELPWQRRARKTHKTTFGRCWALPNFRHPFMSVRCLDERPWNDKKWDFPAVPYGACKRQRSLEPDIADGAMPVAGYKR